MVALSTGSIAISASSLLQIRFIDFMFIVVFIGYVLCLTPLLCSWSPPRPRTPTVDLVQ
jgi:hypothetical protein